MSDHLGRTLRAARTEQQRSVDEIAADAGVSAEMVEALERGQAALTNAGELAAVRLVARALDIDPEPLLRARLGEPEPSEPLPAPALPATRGRTRMAVFAAALVIGSGVVAATAVVLTAGNDADGEVQLDSTVPELEPRVDEPAPLRDGDALEDLDRPEDEATEPAENDAENDDEDAEAGAADTDNPEGTVAAGAPDGDLDAAPPEDTGVQVLDAGGDADDLAAALADHGYPVVARHPIATELDETTVLYSDGFEDEARALLERERRITAHEPNERYATEVPLHVVVVAE